ncbi:MAG: hypothetical protein R2747_13790 [Pyrinomonadaceae bacterium]
MIRNLKTNRSNKLRLLLAFGLICASALSKPAAEARAAGEELEITPNFTGREVAPNEEIELKLNRPVTAAEGSFAVFIGDTDITALLTVKTAGLSYTPGIIPLPAGETALTVYLVGPGEKWKKLAEFPLRVKADAPEDDPATELTSDSPGSPDDWKFEFTPNVSVNAKGQNQTLAFPRENAPPRNPSADLDGQGNLELKVSRGGWTFANKFDFVGVSFRQNAIRFGELENRAPRVDLSSYLIEFGKGRFAVKLGHVSYGSNRHLINSFSSRGITLTLPIGSQNEISLLAANGTSIVGYDNFIGITRRKHSVLSATFAREFFKERPGALRLELSVLRGSLLPLSDFNQGEISDAEKSLGFGFRVLGSDKKNRLRYEAGFTRSRFTNPADPNLEQTFDVTEIRPVTKNARYAEISFDLLQGLKLWKEKKLRLTGTFRHEEIQPLFRSVAAFTQADRRQNQFEISGNFGELNFAYGNLRDHDNLANIASILKTFNRRNNLIFGLPLNSFFTPDKPIKWLPSVSYTFDHTQQFGAFLPTNGDFRDLSQVPDQHSFNQVFGAQWQISEKLNISYTYNRTFQDNRQPGREQADFAGAVNSLIFSVKPKAELDLDFELSREQQKSFEQPRIDRTLRFGTRAAWRMPFLKNSGLSAGLSTTLAGDTNNFNDSRNIEFDAQWTYGFNFGRKKFKKVSGQFFIRYANRYGDTIDRQFLLNSFNKAQTFNAGLTFNFF